MKGRAAKLLSHSASRALAHLTVPPIPCISLPKSKAAFLHPPNLLSHFCSILLLI